MSGRIGVHAPKSVTVVAALLLGVLTACSSGTSEPAGARTAPPFSSPPSPTSSATTTDPEPANEIPSSRSTAPEPEVAAADSDNSPGRHDGSNYGNLSPEGKEAHDTENCAKIPGKKKGSCNEPHRKCRESGATAVSSGGVELTCRTSPKDGRLRWLADGE
ncbi:hypothetical protein ACFQ6V_09445 [Streptomyces roseifaciens]